jgi:transposase
VAIEFSPPIDAKERTMDVSERDVEAAPGISAQLSSSTVSGSKPGAEDRLIGQQQWQEIRDRQAGGQSISAIARELGLDRKTVRTCLRQEAWAPYHREVAAPGLLDAHRGWLSERAPQVRFSARILHQELCAAHGWQGSYETVKLAVRPLRAEANVAALTQRRFETAPGEQAQVDWGQVTVQLEGVPTQVHVFVMTLGYSRRGYAEGYLHERLPNLLAAHEHAFAHFGGCCRSLLYDRMRTVAIGTEEQADGQRTVKLNVAFAAFAQHWGFAVRLCRPYRPRTKGKVESGVKYVKRNFVPGRSFRNLEDFNEQLARWQSEIADVRIHGTTHQRPIDRFVDEAPALIPTAGQTSFLQVTVRERVVASDWLVSIDGNRYSVPFRLIGQSVQVVRVGGQWSIRHRGQLVAEHPVLAGRNELSVRPEHGPGAAVRNTRTRFAERPADDPVPHAMDCEVEIRDLQVYEELAVPQQEAA